MRLTTTLKNAFISSVMADVPSVDYTEQKIKLIQAAANNAQPPLLKKFIKDNPSMVEWLGSVQYYSAKAAISVLVKGCHITKTTLDRNIELQNKLYDLRQQEVNQSNNRKELQKKLQQVVTGCNTRKQLLEALPEFEKYLPKETEPSRNLPAIANLVSDFTQAGWPKKGK